MRIAKPVVFALVASILLAVSGCGLFGGSTHAEPQQVVGNPKDLEKTTIRVGALTTLDTAPLRLAVDEGMFAAEGLNVEVVDIPAGPTGVEKLIAGDLDITFASYPPVYLAERKGAATDQGGLKIVADATSLQKGNSQIVVSKASQLRGPEDLRGKTVAVVGINTMAHLLVLSVLEWHDVGPTDVVYVQMPFDATPAALDNGVVDAAFLTEPSLTDALSKGARPLADTYTASNEGIALCGYAALGDWVTSNGDTLAAFSRVMQRATELANNDRPKVVALLPKYVKGLTPGMASLIAGTKYESNLNEDRLNKVVLAMNEFGLVPDFWTPPADMVIKPAPLTR